MFSSKAKEPTSPQTQSSDETYPKKSASRNTPKKVNETEIGSDFVEVCDAEAQPEPVEQDEDWVLIS